MGDLNVLSTLFGFVHWCPCCDYFTFVVFQGFILLFCVIMGSALNQGLLELELK